MKNFDNEIISLYKDSPMHVVAKELGISVGYVFNRLHALGVETRPQHLGFKGKRHSEEARRAMSRANKGKTVSRETRAKISEVKKIHRQGHKKKRPDGYIYVYFPDHPCSSEEGYIMEHRVVMEKEIGRYIHPDEVVHHKNHVRNDNRIENLQLMTFKEHAALHMRERWVEKKGVLTYQ